MKESASIGYFFAFFQAFCQPEYSKDCGLEDLMFQFTKKPIIFEIHQEYAREYWLWQDEIITAEMREDEQICKKTKLKPRTF